MAFEFDPNLARELEPRLERLDAEISDLEAQLRQKRVIRNAIAILLGHELRDAEPVRRKAPDLAPAWATRKVSARECLVNLLKDAGRPLTWKEIQDRVAELPNPPSPSALTSAFYHNTKAGSRIFVAVGEGYLGLAGRDEGWEPVKSGESGG